MATQAQAPCPLWCPHPAAQLPGQPPGKGCPGHGGPVVSSMRLPRADLLAPGSSSEAESVLRQTQGACFPASRNTASLLAPGLAGPPGGLLGRALHTDRHLCPPRPGLLPEPPRSCRDPLWCSQARWTVAGGGGGVDCPVTVAGACATPVLGWWVSRETAPQVGLQFAHSSHQAVKNWGHIPLQMAEGPRRIAPQRII